MRRQRSADEVLAVVENQEQLLRTHVVDERVHRRLSRLGLETQVTADLRRHEVGVGEQRQLDEPGAIAIAVEGIGCDLQAEAGLAGASRRPPT